MAAAKKECVLILCVDRDNDLGKKTGITGPVIGREENLKAATKLILADPEESDANSIFAAIKKYDSLRKEFQNLEIATITGYDKGGFRSDKELNEQLDFLEGKVKPEAFILVTDGGEDDQVLPLLQSRKKILSKEMVIVKQAQQVESVYYTIKEALKDPYLARIFFGIPGMILLLYALTLYLNVENFFLQGVAFIVGFYFLIKGFGIEARLHDFYESAVPSISLQRMSFIPYVAGIFVLIFAIITLISSLPTSIAPIETYLGAVQGIYFFLTLSAICMVIGKIADAMHFRLAVKLRKYFIYAISIVILWFLLDAGTLVLLGKATVDFFWLAIVVSLAVIFVSIKGLEIFDFRTRVSELLVGLPVYTKNGLWLGTVRKIDKRANTIAYLKGETEADSKTAKKGDFLLKHGRVLLTG
ncbi:MAG: DUF373 family protein [Candidatus Diapherotrites archaeon]|nr:DUF373 family protein [Candidatus Diapherotrites archaeon]